ncbi:MAG TPA: sodium:solute symporter [Gemmatimonadaceae bacterium]|nr:sodium:solute symporter [Gemmatimonadaceae bacterium]
MKTNFTALDFIVLATYLIGTTLLGIWLGRNQKDTKDYFVAGHTIPWWAVLFSVVATETSALTFISIPGLAYTTDLGFLQIAAGYVLGRIVVAYTLLPRYYQGDLVTAYALYEKRFGVATRRFASIVFMVTRALADSVRVFATAIPIALIIGPALPQRFVMPAAILVLGALTLIYTYHGGMRAVVWTDVLQTSVYLFGGLSAVYLLGKGVTGGWGSILHTASAAHKLRAIDLYMGFDRPQTLFAGLLGGAFLSMASHGADQLIVQRLMAASSLKESRKALIGSGIAVLLQFALFLMIGVGLFAFYKARPFAVPDSIFPTFVVDSMPAGLRGLIVAAVLAATMSAHSGALNSLAASTTHDIYLPLSGRAADDPRTLRIAKLFTMFWGVILLVMALLYPRQNTPVVVVALSIASFTYGALLGGFFLGMLWRRATQRDAITGMAVGIVVMSVVVFAKQLIPVLPFMTGTLTTLSAIAWPWYVLIGTSFTVGVGILSSLTHTATLETARVG